MQLCFTPQVNINNRVSPKDLLIYLVSGDDVQCPATPKGARAEPQYSGNAHFGKEQSRLVCTHALHAEINGIPDPDVNPGN